MKEQLSGINDDPQQTTFIENAITFRECKQRVGINGKYQNQLFLRMSLYWISASFFLGLPFFLFKRPIFTDCQNEFNNECIKTICATYQNQLDKLKHHIRIQNSFTYDFNLFCSQEPLRIAYKISPQVLSLIGLLIYGSIADSKGRVVAIKISWRLYAIGLIIFTCTQTQFLITFGYILACVNCFPSLVIQFVLLFQQASRQTRVKASMILLASLVIGPLILSLNVQYILYQIGIRWTLAIFGAIPSFILSIYINNINQSAFYLYRNNKIMAFNILNIIAKINQTPPILVDLSKSSWIKHRELNYSLLKLFRVNYLNLNLIIGIFMVTTIQFNMKSAQISLDNITNSYFRGILMSLSSSAADLTLCFLFLTMKRACRYFLAISILLVFLRLLIVFLNQQKYGTVEVIFLAILAMGIRFLNEMCYGMLLIWSIQIFPTISRGRCCSVVLCGYSLGSLLAYSFKQFWLISVNLQLLLSVCVIFFERYINLNVEGRLYDTINNHKYDEHDKFYIFN